MGADLYTKFPTKSATMSDVASIYFTDGAGEEGRMEKPELTQQLMKPTDAIDTIEDDDTVSVQDDTDAVVKVATFTKVWTWVLTKLASVAASIIPDAQRTRSLGGDMLRWLSVFSGRVDVKNARTDTDKCFDFLHFAQQGEATGPYLGTLHNYTDFDLLRLDNVGTGAIITLNNAHNPTNRSDKGSEFVGSGPLIVGNKYDYGLGGYVRGFLLDDQYNLKTAGAMGATGLPSRDPLVLGDYFQEGRQLMISDGPVWFRFDVKTDNTGTSNDDQFTLPLFATETYDYIVDWGDGTVESFATDSDQTHTYAASGTYEVRVRGTFPRIYFNNGGDRLKITDIKSWGNIVWGGSAGTLLFAFYGCENMNVSATDAPDLSVCFSVQSMFYGCTIFNADISHWDTSSVTNMSLMFRFCAAFDQDLGGWDVESVTNMNNMFLGAGLTTSNYDAILIGWEAQSVQNSVTFVTDATYTGGGAAAAARAALIADHSWAITDGGVAP